jgi:hypothetical protein
MGNWKGIAGLTFTPEEFDGYCHSLRWDAWRPSFIVLHNTAVPSLAQRPSGFTRTHIANLEAFYRDKQGWSAGPHLFIDDRQIWVFTRLTVSGIHSPSWNKLAFGVEMLGDYEREAFDQGRGLKVRAHTVCAIATLCAVTGIDPASLKLHREDILTTHACPGSKVDKGAVIKEIQDVIVSRHGGDHGQPDPQARVAGARQISPRARIRRRGKSR